MTQQLPELLGHVRRHRAEQEREGFHRLDWAALSCDVKKLTNSIKRLMAVLNRSASRSSVTAATVRATTLACSAANSTGRTRESSRTTSASASTIIRQALARKR